MPKRIGFLGVAHMHAWGYAHAIKRSAELELIGFWEEDLSKGNNFADTMGAAQLSSASDLVANSDAVIIASENTRHAELGVLASQAGKDILCEKPLVTDSSDGQNLLESAERNSVVLMTGFPCALSPAFQKLKVRIDAGEIGSILAVNATNRGTCPFDWFIDPTKSGGGAMIDHVVHVADLLWRLLEREPDTVAATTGNKMYGQEWEDCALLTLDYGGGVFCTLDSSWSRPKQYKTWGDVNLTVVGEKGTLETQLFAQQLDVYSESNPAHSLEFYGTDLDSLLIQSFSDAIHRKGKPLTTGEDGFRACQVAFAAYESSKCGQPVPISARFAT